MFTSVMLLFIGLDFIPIWYRIVTCDLFMHYLECADSICGYGLRLHECCHACTVQHAMNFPL